MGLDMTVSQSLSPLVRFKTMQSGFATFNCEFFTMRLFMRASLSVFVVATSTSTRRRIYICWSKHWRSSRLSSPPAISTFRLPWQPLLCALL